MRRRPLAVALATAALISACSGSPSPSSSPAASRTPTSSPSTAAPTPTAPGEPLATYTSQQLSWKDCADGMQCATLRVPLDYSQPAGRTLDLAIDRHPATKDRIGALVVNPGGPGVPGVSYARSLAQSLDPAVLSRYDLVGFDPRGVGASGPVDCLDDGALEQFVETDPTPDDPAEVQALDVASAGLAAGCEQRSGAELPHIGTLDVARDLDVLRAALGDEKLQYLGASYGTAIGETYATLFPQRVGRMVLDGVLDPTLDSTALALGQTKAFDAAFQAYVADCATRRACPIGSTAVAGMARIAQLLADLDRRPMPAGNRRLTEADAQLGLLYPLYFGAADGYPLLTSALQRAVKGDGRELLGLADAYLARSTDGRFKDNELEANYAVNCLDRRNPSSLADVQALLPQFQAASPMFGAAVGWANLICAHWPVPTVFTGAPASAPGAAPILLVGTTGDPATPYDWAVNTSKQLTSSVLLTFEGMGHTAYQRGSGCIDSAINAYLLDGTTPAPGTRCQPG